MFLQPTRSECTNTKVAEASPAPAYQTAPPAYHTSLRGLHATAMIATGNGQRATRATGSGQRAATGNRRLLIIICDALTCPSALHSHNIPLFNATSGGGGPRLPGESAIAQLLRARDDELDLHHRGRSTTRNGTAESESRHLVRRHR